ncbi:hypothetical protein AB0H86_12065 [Streptomyces sp. NPDC050997]|uniref:hypothetical protein n=1 Tax=Streptomyces sp. NPDC050997 TaxID=3155519 RepID=UPI00343C91FA
MDTCPEVPLVRPLFLHRVHALAPQTARLLVAEMPRSSYPAALDLLLDAAAARPAALGA